MDEVRERIVIEPPEKMSVFNEHNPSPRNVVHGRNAVAEAFGRFTAKHYVEGR
jgi:hypothetical protein